ncbi:MAG TPA: hypothetical protein VLF40_00115 [Candidatus Saccharimonadales bacterium]|nr:hypothetical protein [Candidatus Saccharimonadales bacterium]
MSSQKYTDEDLKRIAGIKDDQFNDKLEVLLEVVADIQQKVNLLPKMEDDIKALQSDVKVIRAAVTDTSREVHELDKRVAHLEAAL